MHCRLIQAKLLGYLDGELDRGEADELSAHLASCWTCSQELAALRSEADRLRAALKPFPVPRLELAVMRKLDTIARTPRPPDVWDRLAGPRFWRSVAVCAASLALALAGIALVSPPAYATLASGVVRLAAQASAVAGRRFPVWDELVRAIAALRMLAGI